MKIVKNASGFYELECKPNSADLQNYYQNQYFQEGKSKSYSKSYSDLERRVIYKRLDFAFDALKEVVDVSGFNNFLDVGCGEGFALDYFAAKGLEVEGIDLSRDGVVSHNPGFLENLDVGDVYEKLELRNKNRNKFDLIWMFGVLELVLDPLKLLAQLKTLLSEQGVLVIGCTNNLSPLQIKARQLGLVDNDYCVSPNDHLNYFNLEMLKKFCNNQGWQILDVLANFPIEWFLFNSSSNYIKDKSNGKNAHHARLLLEELIFEQPVEVVNNFYRALAKINMGRNVMLTLKPNFSEG